LSGFGVLIATVGDDKSRAAKVELVSCPPGSPLFPPIDIIGLNVTSADAWPELELFESPPPTHISSALPCHFDQIADDLRRVPEG
jgi:hypothetical protein